MLSNINLLLGNNGMGKTTVLRATASLLCHQLCPSQDIYPYRLVRRAEPRISLVKEASIRADVILHNQDLVTSELVAPIVERMSITIKRQRRL